MINAPIVQDSVTLRVVGTYEIDTTHQFSQEIRLASSGAGQMQWLVGGYFGYYHDELDTGSTVPGLATAGGGEFGTTNLFHVIEPLSLKQEAIFGNVIYRFNDAFNRLLKKSAYEAEYG
jgi:hypothetical protein